MLRVTVFVLAFLLASPSMAQYQATASTEIEYEGITIPAGATLDVSTCVSEGARCLAKWNDEIVFVPGDAATTAIDGQRLTLLAVEQAKWEAIRANDSARLDEANSRDIMAVGDSLTAGSGAGSGQDYPNVLASVLGRASINAGVGGETSRQIADRILAENPAPWPQITLIWIGRNNFRNEERVLLDIQRIIDATGHDRYLVGSILNGEREPLGSEGYAEIQQLNSALSDRYGERFVDIRSALIEARGDTQDIIPASLRFDHLHLNREGYRIVANTWASKIREMGW